MQGSQKGRRFSKVREAVLRHLEKSSEPQSAVEIEKTLAQAGLKVHKTTVYREL